MILLAGAVLFWGTSFAATKSAYATLPPMAVMWLRMTLATLVFLPFWRRLPRPDPRPGDRCLLLLSVTFIPLLYYTLEGWAMVYTSASQAGVVSAIAPLIVAGAAWLVLKEPLSVRSAVGIFVSMAAVAVLALGGRAQESAPAPWLGNLLEVGAMVAAAGSWITIKHLSARYHPWFLTGLQVTAGAVFFLPLAVLTGPVDWGAVTPSTWLAVAYLGIFPSLVAFGLYNSALAVLPAARAALAINVIPAVALTAGWLLLGESLTLVQVAACCVIVAAVSFAQGQGRTASGPVADTVKLGPPR